MDDIQKEHIQEEVTKILQRYGSGVVKYNYSIDKTGKETIVITTTVKRR